MATVWKEADSLGLAIQMHFVPAHAGGIHALASKFSGVPVVLDHLGRPGQGTASQYENVLRLAKLPNTYMKFSGWAHASKQNPPHADLKPLIRKIYDAFGSNRILWGGLGMNTAAFEQNLATLAALFDFADENERALIRGINAAKLYKFPR
jgi:predicted TIM-barrel fold metal-dependent hydrolase